MIIRLQYGNRKNGEGVPAVLFCCCASILGAAKTDNFNEMKTGLE